MKTTKWLNQEEAKALGFTPKTNEKNRNKARYYLNDEEWQKVQEARNSGILQAHQEHGVEHQNSKFLWLKSKNSSIPVQNPFYKKRKEKELEDLQAELIEDLKNYKPKFKKIKRYETSDAHCLVIDPADIHIGKLADSFETGEEYNTQTAVNRVREGVQGILQKAKGFKIDKILFVGGNDILHTDTPKKTTTSGTTQDTDGMWYSNFIKAKNLYLEVLEILIAEADVHFVFNPSNHDYQSGFFLAQLIATYFNKCENITFDCSIAHRKYFQYYRNLIGTTHGDGAKTQDLPLLMAQEAPAIWSKSRNRYVYIHHVHHKTSKDYAGVTVESLRSASGADSWHHRNGFQHAPKAIEGFIHHKEHGQIARLTHLF